MVAPLPSSSLHFRNSVFSLSVGKVDLTLWDLGGEKGHRDLVWPNYVREATSFVYVIDSASEEIEFLESVQVFHELFGNRPNQRAGVPVLILVNKQDLYGARSPAEVEAALDLPRYERHLAAWRIQPASAYDKYVKKSFFLRPPALSWSDPMRCVA
jgi:signal recognition particle receptor subunit beta